MTKNTYEIPEFICAYVSALMVGIAWLFVIYVCWEVIFQFGFWLTDMGWIVSTGSYQPTITPTALGY